jgi:hypothetical protein
MIDIQARMQEIKIKTMMPNGPWLKHQPPVTRGWITPWRA